MSAIRLKASIVGDYNANDLTQVFE